MKKGFKTNNFEDRMLIFCMQLCFFHSWSSWWTLIEATARLEFEDGLRTGVLHGGCWCP